MVEHSTELHLLNIAMNWTEWTVSHVPRRRQRRLSLREGIHWAEGCSQGNGLYYASIALVENGKSLAYQKSKADAQIFQFVQIEEGKKLGCVLGNLFPS